MNEIRRCIFCKENSSSSRSKEHIIPETLGNTEHILAPGIVCDKCNNYFAVKVEKPLLETSYFQQLRARQHIANKKGKIPPQKAFLADLPIAVDVWIDSGSIRFEGTNEAETKLIYNNISNRKEGALYIPYPRKPNAYLISRFLAKVALEVLASKVTHISGWETDVIDKPELDELRDFARRGNNTQTPWHYSERQLHDENQIHQENGESSQILHEYTLLYTDIEELYLVVSIFGQEFALNMGGSEIEGYESWLLKNQNKSPLYMDDLTW